MRQEIVKLREFEAGDWVLFRVPGIHSKLDVAWQGPYRIVRRAGEVNYEIENTEPGKKRHRVVHVNNLKKCKSDISQVRRIVVSTDEVMVDKREMKGKKLTREESKCIEEVLSKHRQCISNEPGETGAAEHEVDTGLNKPIASVPYRLCAQWQGQVKQELESLLAVGIIRESTSPWASPIVPVRKPDGSIRLCVDFRKLNAITEPDPFYMPAVDEVIDKLGEAKYLSKLDLSKGFYQIKVAPKDVPKTAFITPYGKYEFLRMPFGLRNAPSTFQRTMQTV